MPRSILFLAVLLTSATLRAQTPAEDFTKIDAYLGSALNIWKFNGVALVAKHGKVILHKAYGWKDVAGKQHNDTTTRFPILSITKSFTAMAVLKLQEEGKLSLSDKLSKYFPGFPNSDKITIEQLLNHTSGLYNYTDDIGEEDSALVNHPVRKELVLDLVSRKSPAHVPGEHFSYNNSGYYLAGLIIEKVTAKPYEQYIRELIFDPLDMKSSGFDFNDLPANTRATGYQFLNGRVQKPYAFLDATVGFSAGAIYSTVADMYKWVRAIAQQAILSPASWKIAFTPRAGDYGIGFRINNFFGNGYIRHSGGYPGFVSEFVYYPEKDIIIILLKNSGNYGEDIWPVTMGISSIALGLPYDLWKQREPVTLAEAALRKREGKYVADKLAISFTVKDGQLYEVLPGGTELPLLAESDDTFYLENFNTYIKFSHVNDVETATIHEHGKDYELRKTN